ncbi:MAG TPA: hypothetical protein VKA30_04865 [Actinomycetota bacterium]|nr:hypothetical protein [Actinomycetota bacterium]
MILFEERTALRPLLHPSIPVRFADVVAELETIATMATDHLDVDRDQLAEACRRARSLLLILRAQFLEDVVFSEEPPSSRA